MYTLFADFYTDDDAELIYNGKSYCHYSDDLKIVFKAETIKECKAAQMISELIDNFIQSSEIEIKEKMMNPICVKCKVEMKCNKNGVTVAYKEVAHWHKSGDEFICPICHNKVITNISNGFNSYFEADIYISE